MVILIFHSSWLTAVVEGRKFFGKNGMDGWNNCTKRKILDARFGGRKGSKHVSVTLSLPFRKDPVWWMVWTIFRRTTLKRNHSKTRTGLNSHSSSGIEKADFLNVVFQHQNSSPSWVTNWCVTRTSPLWWQIQTGRLMEKVKHDKDLLRQP